MVVEPHKYGKCKVVGGGGLRHQSYLASGQNLAEYVGRLAS